MPTYKTYVKKYLTRSNIGLALNIIGALCIALALGVLPCGYGGTTTCKSGETYAFVYFLNHWQFNLGILLLIFGFILQLKPKSK